MSKESKTAEPGKSPQGVKVEGTFADPWKPETAGETFVGVYLGSQEAQGDRGPFTAFHFRGHDGKRVSISGAGINTIMPQIPKRTEVTITYEGMVRQGKGDMRKFDVRVPPGTQLIDPFAEDAADH